MQVKAVALAHEGHLGIVKTKRILRSKLWFQGIDKMVEEVVGKCSRCQVSTTVRLFQIPIEWAKMPSKAWDEISADFFGPLPTGDYIFTVMDDSTRFAAVKIVRSTSGDTVIPRLDSLFACFGIPSVLRTDNGPPFNG